MYIRQSHLAVWVHFHIGILILRITQEYFKFISPDGYNLFKLLRSSTTGGGGRLNRLRRLEYLATYIYLMEPLTHISSCYKRNLCSLVIGISVWCFYCGDK